jgi:hypothetical protein
MGAQVIPAPHGKATSYATDATEGRVHEFDKAGGEVGLVCTDGNSMRSQGGIALCLAGGPGEEPSRAPSSQAG